MIGALAAKAPHATRAKMTSRRPGRRRSHSRRDWDAIRVDVMNWYLRVKLAQHWNTFAALLLTSGNRAIVEGNRKDDFWGAKLVKALVDR